MEFREIEQIVSARLGEKRARHTFGCAKCARELAARFGASCDDAYLAGLLHDITKELSYENQLKLCEKYGIILDNVSKESPALLHAMTGAHVAKDEFSVSDAVFRAIFYHTTACEDMTTLDLCVWLSDLIEPSREFPGVEHIRAQAENDLTRAVLLGIDQTVAHLISQNKMIHPAMIEARNDILHKIQLK